MPKGLPPRSVNDRCFHDGGIVPKEGKQRPPESWPDSFQVDFRGLGGQHHGLHDILHECFDLESGRPGFLPLKLHQGFSILPVAEIHLDDSVDAETSRHEEEEEGKVFAKEWAPGLRRRWRGQGVGHVSASPDHLVGLEEDILGDREADVPSK